MRSRLIKAAREELVARQGLLELDAVAARANVAVDSIDRHFDSRAGLIGAVVDDFYVRYRSEALEIDPLPRGPFADRERMRTELTVVFHYGEPMAKVVLSGLHGDPEVAALEAAHVDAMIELTANLMAAAQKRGEIAPDRDPTFIGAMLIGGMRRVLAIALASDPPIPRRATASKLWALNAAVMGVTTPFDDG